jgi:hypothetical protein
MRGPGYEPGDSKLSPEAGGLSDLFFIFFMFFFRTSRLSRI